MSDIGKQPIKDVYQKLLQISSSGEIANASGSGVGLSLPNDGGLTVNGDLIVTGSITAQTYTVSSSVTNQQFIYSSGSTIFGDSWDDLHHFTGSLAGSSSKGGILGVKGHLSASGDLIGNDITASGEINFLGGFTDTYGVYATHTQAGYWLDDANRRYGINMVAPGSQRKGIGIRTGNTDYRMFISGSTKGNVSVNAPLSEIDNLKSQFQVGGDIWASGSNGHITASGNLRVDGTYEGNITASGNISASGIIYSDVISFPSGSKTSEHASGTTSGSFISSSNNIIDISAPGLTKVRISQTGLGINSACPILYLGNDGQGNHNHGSLKFVSNALYVRNNNDSADSNVNANSYVATVTTDTSYDTGNGRGSEAKPAYSLGKGNNAAAGYAGMYGVGNNPVSVNFSTDATRRMVIHTAADFDGGIETSGSLSVGTLGEQTGHITASGNISASGALKGSSIVIDARDSGDVSSITTVNSGFNITANNASTWQTTAGALTIEGETGLNLNEGGSTILEIADNRKVKIYNTSPGLFVDTHITASGNISASGDIHAEDYFIEGTVLAQYAGGAVVLGPGGAIPLKTSCTVEFQKALSVATHITASGNISASGTGPHYFSGSIRTHEIRSQGGYNRIEFGDGYHDDFVLTAHNGDEIYFADGIKLGKDSANNARITTAGAYNLSLNTRDNSYPSGSSGYGGFAASSQVVIGTGTNANIQLQPHGIGQVKISGSGLHVIGNSGGGAAGFNHGGHITASGNVIVQGDITSSGATIYNKNTWANDDDTPSLSGGTYFETGTNTDTVTGFDDGIAGQTIYVISRAAITYSHDAGNLKCGTADILTAANDLTSWIFDGTNWILISFTDQSDDLS
jgi:cytoskeletal protein CcmA (bactofilin family)